MSSQMLCGKSCKEGKLTSWEGPSDKVVGSLFSNACSDNFIALWSSFRCPHFGSLGNPKREPTKYLNTLAENTLTDRYH